MKFRLFMIALLCLSALALASCAPADEALLRDFIDDWRRSKGLNPLDEEGNIDTDGAISTLFNVGSRIITGSTGDDQTDAALGIFEVIDSIQRADRLMAQGRAENDPAKMDEAIEMRPDDWSYRVGRASYALENGDVDTFQTNIDHANEVGQGSLPYLNDSIAELEALEDRIFTGSGEPFQNSEQCTSLYNTLSQLYADRAEITSAPADQAQAAGYQTQASYCQ